MPNQNIAQLNDVFRGLADPTRRAVIEQLSLGPAAVTTLARPFSMALPSFAQHLDVLEECGLVSSTKVGRVRTYRLRPGPLKRADAWLNRRRAAWEKRLDQLDAQLMTMKEQTK